MKELFSWQKLKDNSSFDLCDNLLGPVLMSRNAKAWKLKRALLQND